MPRRAQFHFSSTYSEASDVPAWADTLHTFLSDKLDNVELIELPAVYALQECRIIADSIVNGTPAPRTPDRTALREELGRSLHRFSPKLEVVAGVARQAITNRLEQLPDQLASVQGANDILGQVEALLDILSSEEAVRAAWNDVVEVFQRLDSTHVQRETALVAVRTILELRDVDWNERARRIGRIYADWIGEICIARDEPLPPDTDPTSSSGIPFNQRQLIAEDILAVPARREDAVVHLAIENATLNDDVVQIGSHLTLYRHNMWPTPPNGADETADDTSFPELVEHMDTARSLLARVDATTVFARIELSAIPPAVTVDTARKVLRDVLDLVDADNAWTILDGYLVARENSYSTRGFTPTSDSPQQQRDASWTARRLSQSKDDERVQIAIDHAGRSSQVDQAFDEIRWLAAIKRTPDSSHRLVLTASALERILPRREHETWDAAAIRHLRRWWSHDTAMSDVYACATNIAWALPTAGSTIGASIGPEVASVHLPTAMRELPTRVSELPEGSHLRADVAEVVSYLESGTASRRWIRQLDADFELLIKRWRRQRNSATHGTPVHPQVVKSVSRFAHSLHRVAVNAVFATIGNDAQRLATVLQIQNNDLEMHRQRLSGGELWSDVLEAPSDEP